MNYPSQYRPPTLTVDAIIFQIVDGQLQVGLVQRTADPFKGEWALPGGYSPEGETTLEALERIVAYKAGIAIKTDLSYIEQLYTFDTVARDPRGHAVSVTYMGCSRLLDPSGGETAAVFFPVTSLPAVAYDHMDIIRYAHDRLKAKLTYTNAVYAFLPQYFTLADVQSAYEAVLGNPLDKRNFRKKFLSLGLIQETDQMRSGGAHRPARLYEFASGSLQALSRSFD